MFFYLSKIAFFVIRPSNFSWLLAVIGLITLLLGWRRASIILLAIGLGAQAIFLFTPIPNALIYPLEERFPRPDLIGLSVDGIIVLGGSVEQDVSETRAITSLNEAAERLTAAADLARRYPEARLVFTGGSAAIFKREATEAQAAARGFQELGLDPDRVVLEDKSRNTYENAVLTRELMQPLPSQTWLLVTSAFHMPRSMGVFRQTGWQNVIAFPVDYRTAGRQDLRTAFWALSEGGMRTDVAIREWIGLIVYRLTGRTNAFFPAP